MFSISAASSLSIRSLSPRGESMLSRWSANTPISKPNTRIIRSVCYPNSVPVLQIQTKRRSGVVIETLSLNATATASVHATSTENSTSGLKKKQKKKVSDKRSEARASLEAVLDGLDDRMLSSPPSAQPTFVLILLRLFTHRRRNSRNHRPPLCRGIL